MSILDNIKNIKKANIKVMNGEEEIPCYSLGGFFQHTNRLELMG